MDLHGRHLIAALAILAPLAASAAPTDQWASRVIGFSTQYTTTTYSAAQATKPPDVAAYGDNQFAWAPSTGEAGLEFIALGFPIAVYANGATIRETYGYGFVVGIDAIDAAGTPHTVWNGPDNGTPNQINTLEATWPQTSYLVTGLRIRINTALHGGYEEIDAVQLHGLEPVSGTLAPRLGHSATLTCTNTTTGQTVTKAIKGPGKKDPVRAFDCEAAGLDVNVGESVTIQIKGKVSN